MNPRTPVRTTRRIGAAIAALALVVTACGTDPTVEEPPAGTPSATSVRLLTHASFNASEEVLAAFTAQTGVELEILRGDDAGTVVNQAILSAGNPQADVLFGIDNTLLGRALAEDVFIPYTPAALEHVDPALILDPEHRVVPIDRGDVCLNYDVEAFEASDAPVPESLADLTDPTYAGQLVVMNPATSSPGLSFLLATVATFGEDGYEQFWEDLVANDVEVTSGWTDAYYGHFSGSGGSDGDRPLVVSYASSPPAEVIFAETELDRAPTGVIEASCFQQIEFAGILNGTDRQDVAELLIDFLLSVEFQEDIPLNMFVFPARTDVDLPPEFVEHTVIPSDPIRLDPEVIDANREDWIRAWTRIVLG